MTPAMFMIKHKISNTSVKIGSGAGCSATQMRSVTVLEVLSRYAEELEQLTKEKA